MKINGTKVFITHGIYKFVSFGPHIITIRNTDKHFPLPLKFRSLLHAKYLRWWYVKTSIYRFRKRISINVFVDMPIEFTIAHVPDKHISVISIVHPTDYFIRSVGVRMVNTRMKWALENPIEVNSKSWAYKLE